MRRSERPSLDGPRRRSVRAVCTRSSRTLTTLIAFVKKDLDQIEQGDMERFIRALEYDEIRSKRKELWGRPSTIEKRTLSERYKVDIKMTVRKFYKWLWGNSRTYPPIVEWIDTSARATEIPALTEAEVSRMLESCSTVLQRALIQVLFDGGFRASELLNVRLKHVRSVEIQNDHGTAPCFVLRVCFSKTLSRTVPLPMEASAKWLGMWLANHPEEPVLQPDGTVKARNLDAQLFPITVGGMGRLLREIGRRSIGKHVWPHLMRHTSATWWSNHVSHYKLCKRFGWSMTSDMPKRYIDREGVDEMDVAKVIRANPRMVCRGSRTWNPAPAWRSNPFRWEPRHVAGDRPQHTPVSACAGRD